MATVFAIAVLQTVSKVGGSCQLSVVSCQLSVVSGQWAVGSGQFREDDDVLVLSETVLSTRTMKFESDLARQTCCGRRAQGP